MMRKRGLTEEAATASIDQSCRMLRLPTTASSSRKWPTAPATTRCPTAASSPSC